MDRMCDQAEAAEAIVEVCCGAECLGVCAGAALIEIEELCMEENENSAKTISSSGGCGYRAVRSKCLGSCGKGPNVRVRKGDFEISYSSVDSPSKCLEIVTSIKNIGLSSQQGEKARSAALAAALADGPSEHEKEGHGIAGIMSRRAEGMRWAAMKAAYRDGAKGMPMAESSTRGIEQAGAAEKACRKGEPERSRVDRRVERIKAIVAGLSKTAGECETG
jgi:(2Fe-2S) ferredoxin